MGLNEVIQEIMNNARKEVAEIEKQAREETAEILARAKAEVKAKEDAADEDFVRLKEAAERKAISSANLDAKKQIHETKRKLLEQVYEIATQQIEKMDTKTRENLLKKIASSNDLEDVAVVYVNKKDAKVASSLFKGAKVKETEILGGVILENKDGTVRVDKSFDQLLATAKEKRLKETSEKLFGK